MHELPVVQDIIKVVNSEAEKGGYKKVKSILVTVGELSSVVDESAQMYFELLAQGTPCERAMLRFEHIPAMLRCAACGNEFEHRASFSCPVCGGDGILVQGTGRELYVKAIEVDEKA